MKKNWAKQKIQQSKKHQLQALSTVNSLVVKSRNGKYFTLQDGEDYLEFMCCSYLGLDLDARIINAGLEPVNKLGVNLAISRTRVRAEPFDLLENALNKIFCNAYTTVFSSLHVLHAGMIPLLASGELPNFPIQEAGCCFIIDKYAHASMQLVRGTMEQFGSVLKVDFNDEQALINAFQKSANLGVTPITVSDSIISMGGVVPILKLLQLAEKYNGYTYIDDAHGTSILGKNGCGYTLNLLENKLHDRLILTASLSKGFGTNCAAIVLKNKEDINYVRLYCIPYIFSNPPPLGIIAASMASAKIHLSNEIYTLQKKLWNNVAKLDDLLGEQFCERFEYSPIRRLLIGDESEAIQAAQYLKQNHILVAPSMYPSVAKGRAILRIVISAAHTDEQINRLAKLLKKRGQPRTAL